MKPNPYEDETGNLDLGPAWAPPPPLTLATLEALKDIPRLWLADAINLMAFGKRADLTELGNFRRRRDPSIKRDGTANFANIAQRMRAAKALLSAARARKAEVLHSPTKSADVSDLFPVPAHNFDFPRMLGHNDNTIGPDLHAAAKEENHEFYRAAWAETHLKGVRVKMAPFVAWLKSEMGIAGLPAGSSSDGLESLSGQKPNDAKPRRGKRAVILRIDAELTARDGEYAGSATEHYRAIRAEWPKGGRAPCDKTILRAFQERDKTGQ